MGRARHRLSFLKGRRAGARGGAQPGSLVIAHCLLEPLPCFCCDGLMTEDVLATTGCSDALEPDEELETTLTLCEPRPRPEPEPESEPTTALCELEAELALELPTSWLWLSLALSLSDSELLSDPSETTFTTPVP